MNESITPERQRNNDKKVLVLGGDSYVGQHVLSALGSDRAIATYYEHPIDDGIYFDSLSMSLSQIVEAPERISHAVVLFGDTKPESCAADVARSNALNVDSIRSVIDSLNRLQIKPVFTSSECVFDGATGNYVETDPVHPIIAYGRQKVEIEQHLQSSLDEFVIVRLGKVLGLQSARGNIFTEWLDALEKRQTMYCAYDQVFSPIYAEDVAVGIVRLIDQDCNGIFHLSGSRPFSRLQLLETFLRVAKRYSTVEPRVVPCSIRDFELREKRPLDVSMVPDKIVATVGLEITEVERACEHILARIFKAA